MIIELFYACMGSEFQSQERSTQRHLVRCSSMPHRASAEPPCSGMTAGRSAATHIRKSQNKVESAHFYRCRFAIPVLYTNKLIDTNRSKTIKGHHADPNT